MRSFPACTGPTTRTKHLYIPTFVEGPQGPENNLIKNIRTDIKSNMRYKIRSTETFENWLLSLKSDRARIARRIERIESGNFGDFKNVEGSLYELRFFFGPGYRVYYTIKGNEVVLLLNGGHKSSPTKDIKKAIKMLNELE